ncbi:MAG: YdcF family protein [Bowdeniella nasicola]|nr:YdcF family protein [Bowdeniella nasicola]
MRKPRLLTTFVSVLLLAALLPQAWRIAASTGRVQTLAEVQESGEEVPDVVAVLGAAIWGPDTPSRYLAYRLDTAIAVYRPGMRVVVSGDGRDPNYSETAVMRAYLRERGVREEDIEVDGLGLDSMSTCRYLAAHDVDRVALISQTYHLPRAVALCRSLDLDATGIGDEEGRIHEHTWRGGVIRELAATYKAAAEALAAQFVR